LIGISFLTAVLIAMGSYWLGSRWATEEMEWRFQGMKQTLSNASFPLTASVLLSLAELTQTDLITLDSNYQVRLSSLSDSKETPLDKNARRITIDGNRYRIYSFDMSPDSGRIDGVASVVVLFDERTLDASSRRAAALPLWTGLSTLIAFSTVAYLWFSRLIQRLSNLEYRVTAVADGDFKSTVSDSIGDEVGRLGDAVDSMASQLNQLWQRVHRQQSEKLLHQLAGGMAHQLRNSLTGARMAIEMHARECTRDDAGMRVALQQLEVSEDYIRRLLLVASGRQDQPRPRAVLECWQDINSSLTPIAKHLRVEIHWNADKSLRGAIVQDGPTWTAAVTNLVHNAIQAGSSVEVHGDVFDGENLRVVVSDNGPGISSAIADSLFEPFVTTKPEGLGLGLPVVRRAADDLGGKVTWSRRDEGTHFELIVKVHYE
jgi:hypothetical protein